MGKLRERAQIWIPGKIAPVIAMLSLASKPYFYFHSFITDITYQWMCLMIHSISRGAALALRQRRKRKTVETIKSEFL
jgi:hypothetical protein